ncbi:hypothetical protein AYI70_g7361 [Smittium culicis]|uniref:Uncharacterized protein n=1 Tax=Smittium culicis TaxID=133412 RepID=A0A1R1XL01_9FUNG|nr:hypothetical protein AYI70_g7361 [Smittium culicis]
MENQRSALKEKGVSNNAIELIFTSQPSVRRRPIYYPIQQKYKVWHRKRYKDSAISVMSVAFYGYITDHRILQRNRCGFMRASDIHRTVDAQTTTIDRTLKLVIVAPKEKRKGRQIIRPY